MFMWMKLEGGVKDADDIIDALQEEKVAVVPGDPLLLWVLAQPKDDLICVTMCST